LNVKGKLLINKSNLESYSESVSKRLDIFGCHDRRDRVGETLKKGDPDLESKM
jgi:hypothetical protein